MVTEPAIHENTASPVTQPSIFPATETVTTEREAICNAEWREADRMRCINTNGFQSPGDVKLLTKNDMFVTRSRSNEMQHQEEESEHHQDPEQEPTTSREVAMDVTEPDRHGLAQWDVGIKYGSPLRFGDVPPDDFRAIVSIPWFKRTAVDEDAKNYFGRVSLYAQDDQFYWAVEAEDLSTRVWR